MHPRLARIFARTLPLPIVPVPVPVPVEFPSMRRLMRRTGPTSPWQYAASGCRAGARGDLLALGGHLGRSANASAWQAAVPGRQPRAAVSYTLYWKHLIECGVGNTAPIPLEYQDETTSYNRRCGTGVQCCIGTGTCQPCQGCGTGRCAHGTEDCCSRRGKSGRPESRQPWRRWHHGQTDASH